MSDADHRPCHRGTEIFIILFSVSLYNKCANSCYFAEIFQPCKTAAADHDHVYVDVHAIVDVIVVVIVVVVGFFIWLWLPR